MHSTTMEWFFIHSSSASSIPSKSKSILSGMLNCLQLYLIMHQASPVVINEYISPVPVIPLVSLNRCSFYLYHENVLLRQRNLVDYDKFFKVSCLAV
ncbi:hypothetical protein BDZ91DRAFT_718698 [Kalaharituber pfeilii]|nr:hypothetical protein BDZ91DRAFT_718698 [Kalaharituber pfeilii]